jgi:hypothetical protein
MFEVGEDHEKYALHQALGYSSWNAATRDRVVVKQLVRPECLCVVEAIAVFNDQQ